MTILTPDIKILVRMVREVSSTSVLALIRRHSELFGEVESSALFLYETWEVLTTSSEVFWAERKEYIITGEKLQSPVGPFP